MSNPTLSRTVGALAIAIAGATITISARAASAEPLFQRAPNRLVIESGERVSDGRKLSRDADENFRRAEGGAASGEGDRSGGGADDRSEGPARTGSEASDKSAATGAGVVRE